MRYVLTRYEPQDAPQNRIVAFLRTMYGEAVLNSPMLKSTAISDAGLVANDPLDIVQIDPKEQQSFGTQCIC
jgi:cellulose biosynthesis protein BcsQ